MAKSVSMKRAELLARKIRKAAIGLDDAEMTTCSETSDECMDAALRTIPNHRVIREFPRMKIFDVEPGFDILIENAIKTSSSDSCRVYEIGIVVPGIGNHWFNIYQCKRAAVLGNSWEGYYRYRTTKIPDIVTWFSQLKNELMSATLAAKDISPTTSPTHSKRSILSVMQKKTLERFGKDNSNERAVIKTAGYEASDVPFNHPSVRGKISRWTMGTKVRIQMFRVDDLLSLRTQRSRSGSHKKQGRSTGALRRRTRSRKKKQSKKTRKVSI